MLSDLSGARVLVVDDEAPWRDDLIPPALRGASITKASSVVAAIGSLRRNEFDIVIVDLLLDPRHSLSSGYDVARAARRRGIPVILLTACPEMVLVEGENLVVGKDGDFMRTINMAVRGILEHGRQAVGGQTLQPAPS